MNLPGGHDFVARIMFPIHFCQQRFQGSSLPGYEVVVKHKHVYLDGRNTKVIDMDPCPN